jgi:hypothetical protein
MEELKAYPPWRYAFERIVKDVETDGYGRLYTHAELKQLLDMKEPTTIEEYKAHEFDYLNNMDQIKTELLMEHNLCLDNDYGKGYRLKEPAEQITEVADAQMRKAQRAIGKATRLLTHVNEKLLDAEMAELRLRKMQRNAFIQAAFRKRKLPSPKTRPQLSAISKAPQGDNG